MPPPDARLQHRQHRRRRLVAPALGLGADQLFEEQRVPSDCSTMRATVAEPARGPSTCCTSRSPAFLLRGRSGMTCAEPRSSRGEQLVHLGPGQPEHQGAVAQLAQREVAQLHRERVAPVQILEHQPHRAPRGLGAQEVERRLRNPIAHNLRDLPGRPQLRVVVVGERHAAQLAQEDNHPPASGRTSPMRRASLSRCTSWASPSRMPQSRRSAWLSRP